MNTKKKIAALDQLTREGGLSRGYIQEAGEVKMADGGELPPLADLEAALVRADAAAAKAENLWATVAAGCRIELEGITLAIDAKDRQTWTSLAVFLSEAIRQKRIAPTTEIPIRDIDGVPHLVTSERFLEIFVDLGFAYLAADAAAHS